MCASRRLFTFVVPLVLFGLMVQAARVPAAGDDKPWPEILSPAQGTVPAPQAEVVWRSDLSAAMAEAQGQNRPLLVMFRCPPCKQSCDLHDQILLGSPALTPLFGEFVTVKLTNILDIDLGLFPTDGYQDYDLSLWIYFLSPEGRVYSVFGGKDEAGDYTRVTARALETQMQRVLAHHYDPRRPGWDVDGPLPGHTGDPARANRLAGFDPWLARHPNALNLPKAMGEGRCMHCHQLGEVRREPAIGAGTFDKVRDTQIWPFPENVGCSVDRDDGLTVTAVAEGGAAAKAGLQVGDVLAAAGDRKLFGQTDFRAVLHRAPMGACQIPVQWLRGGKLMGGELVVADGWRRTVLDWRTSMAGGSFGAGPEFWPLACSSAERERYGIGEDTLAVKPWFGPNPSGPAFEAGLRQDDVVVAVDGEKSDKANRAFMIWFRMNHEPGDQVTITARKADRSERQVRYTLAKPQ